MTWWIWLLIVVWYVSGVIAMWGTVVVFCRTKEYWWVLLLLTFCSVVVGPFIFVINKIETSKWLNRD